MVYCGQIVLTNGFQGDIFYFGVELESDDVDTIAGYYLTGVGTIPTTEKISYELVSQNKQIVLTNDKVKNGRVTKVKVQITELEPEEETE